MKLTVNPYKTPEGVWAFDHEHLNTKRELLCNGTEIVIDAYYKQLTGKDATAGDQMTFILNTEPFPESATVITFVGGDNAGSNYVDQQTQMTLWLCPWLQGYFGHVPKDIYILPAI